MSNNLLGNAFIAAVVTAALVYATGGTLIIAGSFWGSVVAYTALYASLGVLQKVLAPRANQPGAQEISNYGGGTANTRVLPARWLFGRRRVACPVARFSESHNTFNTTSPVSEGEIETLEKMWVLEHSPREVTYFRGMVYADRTPPPDGTPNVVTTESGFFDTLWYRTIGYPNGPTSGWVVRGRDRVTYYTAIIEDLSSSTLVSDGIYMSTSDQIIRHGYSLTLQTRTYTGEPSDPGAGDAPYTDSFSYQSRTIELDVHTQLPFIEVTEFFDNRNANYGRGLSYIRSVYRQSEDDWLDTVRRIWTGPPRLEYLFKGIKITYPTRDDQGRVVLSEPEWTSNPAKIRAWMLMERRGVSMDQIDVDALAESINICDEKAICVLATTEENLSGVTLPLGATLSSEITSHSSTGYSGEFSTDNTTLGLHKIRALKLNNEILFYVWRLEDSSPKPWGSDLNEMGDCGEYQGKLYVANANIPAGWWDLQANIDAGPENSSLWESIEDSDFLVGLGDDLKPEEYAIFHPTFKRYEAHGVISSGESLHDIGSEMDATMGGHTVVTSGKYFIRAGMGEKHIKGEFKIPTPVATIEEEDLLSPGVFDIQVAPAREDIVNRIVIELEQDEENSWLPGEMVVEDRDKIEKDEETLSNQIRLGYVTSKIQARALGNFSLMKQRHPLNIDMRVRTRIGNDNVKLLATVLPGDVLELNLPHFPLEGERIQDNLYGNIVGDYGYWDGGNKLLFVTRSELNIETMEVRLTLTEYIPGSSLLYGRLPHLNNRLALPASEQ